MMWTMICRRFVALPLLLLFGACRVDAPALPFEEVLRNAVMVSQTVTSAAFRTDASIAFRGGSFGDGGGNLHLQGTINDGGRLVATAVDGSLRFRDGEGQDRTVRALLDTVSVNAQRFYLMIRSLVADPSGGIFDATTVQRLQGVWWEFSREGSEADLTVAPSIRLLQAQASVVTVTRDLGVDRVDGVPAYHYAVVLDPERFFVYMQALAEERGEQIDEQELRTQIQSLQATGELWISAQDFHLLRADWEIPSLRMTEGSLVRVESSTVLSQYGAAPAIQMPAQSQPFPDPATMFFETDPDRSLPQGVSPSDLRSAVGENADTAIFPPSE
jgi:hypothetical protein